MFEQYKIAVKISLVNHVSSALSGLSRDFAKTDAQAMALQKRIDSIKNGLKGGLISAGAGLAIAGMFKPAIDDAMKFERAMLRLKDIGGMSPQYLSLIRGEALSGKYKGIAASEAVDLFRDLHAAFGNAKDAHEFLPLFAGVARVTQGKYGKSAVSGEADVKALAQVAERRFGTKSPEAMESALDLAMKMQNASGGAVTPTDLRAFMARMGAMQMGMSNDGIMKMWALMQEQGGSKAGTALNSALQNLVNGRGTEGSGFVLRKIGWVDDKANQKHLKEIYGENWGKHLNKVTANSLVDVGGAKKDFVGWVEGVGLPLISKYLDKQGITDMKKRQDETTSLLAQALSNRLGADSTALIATQLPRILKDYNLAVNSPGARESIASYDESPMAKFQKLKADYDTAMINLGLAALPVLIPMVNRMTDAFKRFNDYAQKNPEAVNRVAKGLLGLSAALIGFGTLTLVVNGIKALGVALSFTGVGGIGGVAGLTAIGEAFLPISAGIVAIGAALYSVKWLYDFAGSDDKAKFLGTGTAWYQRKPSSSDDLAKDGNILPFGKSRMDINTVNPASNKTIQVNSTLVVDGKKQAESVTYHQAKSATKPTSGQAAYDSRMQIIPAGMSMPR